MAAQLAIGDILQDYPYLWLRQRRAGETEGRKPRPVCVAIAVVGSQGQTHVALLPLSSQAPAAGQSAVELPEAEIRRANLQAGQRIWIYTGEYNYDIAERSYYLRRQGGTGHSLSLAFMKKVLAAFRPTLVSGAARVDRR